MMANLSDDIECAGSDTHPPMLDRTNFESWQQCIRLYCLGKDNEVNILKSIDEGPFKMGKFRETLAEGALHLGPEQDRVFADLTPEEKERFKADIHAMNILLQGLPKDIYTLINHYIDAKDIWDNENMLLEDLRLINDMRNIKMTMPKMQLNSKFVNNMLPEWGFTPTDDLIENLTKLVALLAQSYKTHLHQTNNQLRTLSNTRNQATFQNGRVVVQNVWGAVVAGNEGAQNRVGNTNPAQENGVVLDEEQLLFIAGGQTNTFHDDVDEAPVQDLALNEDNVFRAD
ncbi:hypothetical protein Tco_0885769 [Tanacetum coccineum]